LYTVCQISCASAAHRRSTNAKADLPLPDCRMML
jgi:hypothetical protein